MKYAVLGGGGCFGLNFARFALQQKHLVIGCGRSALRGEAFTLSTDAQGYKYRTFVVGPDNEFLVDWLEEEKPDVIVNFAAQGEGAASYRARHWKYFYRTNVEALVDLTERLHGKKWLHRFVQVGTSEVYGSVKFAADEEAPLRPSSPYAVSKLAFDQHLVSIAKTWKFPAIVCRPSNCVTVGQQLHRVVPKTFLLGLTGRKLQLHGGGKARKCYMDAEDLSHALTMLAQLGAVGEVYNVGPEKPVTIRSLVDICAEKMSRVIEDVSVDVPDRTGQDSCYWIDSGKIRALGWDPQVSLGAAVERVGAWVQEYLPELKVLPTDYEMRA